MQKRKQIAGVLAVAATALLTVLRLYFPPQGTGLRGNYVITVCAAAVSLVVLFVLCGTQRVSAKRVTSVPAKCVAGAMIFVGVLWCISSIGVLVDLFRGIYPYPQPVTVTTVGSLLVWIGALSALVGGFFFMRTAAQWFVQGRTDRNASGFLALLPVVWTWSRILWYMTSFASAANRFRSLFEIAMLLFEMLFLLAFARHIAGMEEEPPRFALPITLCEAMLGLVVFFTRFGAFVMQDADLFGSTALVTAPDFGIALLAVAFAIGQLMPNAQLDDEDVEQSEKPVNTPAAEPEEGDATFLLNESEIALTETEDDEEPAAETERKPLELEDIINEIINGNR